MLSGRVRENLMNGVSGKSPKNKLWYGCSIPSPGSGGE